MVQHENIDEQDTGNVQRDEGSPKETWQKSLKNASPEAAEQLKSAQGGNKGAGGPGNNLSEDHPQSQQPQKAGQGPKRKKS